jgi:cold-inducible RNA-binding protein
MRLFIANIANSLEEAQLQQMLTQFGQVDRIKLVTDAATGRRKGFGFVEMPVKSEALAAIASLNGKDMGGRKMALSEAKDKPNTNSRPMQRSPKRYHTDNSGEIDGNHW